jgi:hypothetical protein
LKDTGSRAEVMKLSKNLTVDDLITAFVEYGQNKDSHEKIEEYYKLQLELMQKLFGVDFADFENRIRAKEFPSEHSENLEKYYEFNGFMTVSNFHHCINLLSITKNPFNYGVLLAGMLPKISRDLEEKYDEKSSELIYNLDGIYRDVAKELLVFMFPGIESKQIDGKKLYELGLPKEKPDYWDLVLAEDEDDD